MSEPKRFAFSLWWSVIHDLWVNLGCHTKLAGLQWKWHMQAVVPMSVCIWAEASQGHMAREKTRILNLKGKVSFSSMVPKSWKWTYSMLIYAQNSLQGFKPNWCTPLPVVLCSGQLCGQVVRSQKHINMHTHTHLHHLLLCDVYVTDRESGESRWGHFSSCTTWAFLDRPMPTDLNSEHPLPRKCLRHLKEAVLQ